MSDVVAGLGIGVCALCRKAVKVDPIVLPHKGWTCKPCGARMLELETMMEHEGTDG